MSTAPVIVMPADLPPPYAGPPLRIAYVSNTRHPWCTENHVGSSLKTLGHSVRYLQEDELDWSKVPSLVAAEGIQLLLWTRTWPAEMAVVEPVLKELAAEGIPTVSYHLDRWFGLDRAHQVDDQPFFRTSLVISPDDSPQWVEHGVNHFWLPPGVFGPECEPVAPNPRRWPYDVVFVGTVPYPHPEWAPYRQQLLGAFRREFARFGVLPRKGQPVRGHDLQELYATVPVVLGDSCLAGESNSYWSDRIPESLGRGATLIHPEVAGMGSWYSGQRWEHGSGDLHPYAQGLTWPPDSWGDLLTYKLGDFAQSVDLAKWALAHPDSAAIVGANGRDVVTKRDTYAHRMGTVLAVAEGIHGGYRGSERRGASRLGAMPDEVRRFLADANYGRPVGESRPCVPPPCPAEEIGWVGLPSMGVKLHRWSAVFEPRPGTTDEEVWLEVWRNDYKVPPEGFRRGVVVDIGANVGAFAVLAAKAGASVVYAYEPEPENRARLEHHIKINGVERQVKVLPLAVTDGSLPTVDMIGTGGGARTTVGGSIVTTTLAEVIAMHGPVTFMKVDAEGAEGPMFAAVSAEDLADVDRIGMEWHGPDGPPGHPGAPHLAYLTGEEFGPLVTKLADAGEVLTFGHPRRGGIIHWRRYGA